jgi:hypothetical protein
MVGDPEIEPGVRLREGVTVPSVVRGISTKQGANASMVQGVAVVIRCV